MKIRDLEIGDIIVEGCSKDECDKLHRAKVFEIQSGNVAACIDLETGEGIYVASDGIIGLGAAPNQNLTLAEFLGFGKEDVVFRDSTGQEWKIIDGGLYWDLDGIWELATVDINGLLGLEFSEVFED